MKRDIFFCVILGLVLTTIGCKKQPTPTAKKLSYAATPGALCQAARVGDIRQVESLIASGVDVNARSTGSWTALHHAAVMGQKAVVELLTAQGAQVDVNAK